MTERELRAVETGSGVAGSDAALTPKDRLVTLEKTFERLLEWIAGIDRRIGFVFAVDVAMLGALATLSPSSFEGWTSGQSAWAAIAVLCLSGSLVSLVTAVFPRLDGPKQSLLFFGGIVGCEVERFKICMKELSFEQYFEDLSTQCYRNAEIAEKKYRWLQRAMLGTCAAVPAWLIGLFLLYQPG